MMHAHLIMVVSKAFIWTISTNNVWFSLYYVHWGPSYEFTQYRYRKVAFYTLTMKTIVGPTIDRFMYVIWKIIIGVTADSAFALWSYYMIYQSYLSYSQNEYFTRNFASSWIVLIMMWDIVTKNNVSPGNSHCILLLRNFHSGEGHLRKVFVLTVEHGRKPLISFLKQIFSTCRWLTFCLKSHRNISHILWYYLLVWNSWTKNIRVTFDSEHFTDRF